MTARTATETVKTYVVPVAAMTLLFAAVLAYGPAALSFAVEVAQGIWDGVVTGFTWLSTSVDHFFAIGQNARPASGLGCWDEIKTALPTEHLCGDVTGAPGSAANFTAYPTN